MSFALCFSPQMRQQRSEFLFIETADGTLRAEDDDRIPGLETVVPARHEVVFPPSDQEDVQMILVAEVEVPS